MKTILTKEQTLKAIDAIKNELMRQTIEHDRHYWQGRHFTRLLKFAAKAIGVTVDDIVRTHYYYVTNKIPLEDNIDLYPRIKSELIWHIHWCGRKTKI